MDDQREASGRPDVLAFTSDVLKEPVKISGQPVANLVASTSGTDSDWVVKVIDVYPDEVAAQPSMGGYQLMVSADIFRGRYRERLDSPKAIASNVPLLYKFTLPTVNHVFLPGHRIMVQVQSSWFPLYDRNPQTLRAEYLLGQAGRLQKSYAACVSFGRPREFYRTAGGRDEVSRISSCEKSVMDISVCCCSRCLCSRRRSDCGCCASPGKWWSTISRHSRVKNRVKVPLQALKSPENISVNQPGPDLAGAVDDSRSYR